MSEWGEADVFCCCVFYVFFRVFKFLVVFFKVFVEGFFDGFEGLKVF